MKNTEENVDTSYHTGKDREKGEDWSSWAFKHFNEMKLAKRAGLFPKQEGWRNTVEHSLVVNALAVYTAGKIKEAGHLLDLDLVDKGGILHDIAKRRDKEKGVSRNNKHSIGATKELLKQGGYSKEVTRVAEYTGRVPEIYLGDTEQTDAVNNKSLEDLVVAYSDARVRNTNIVSLEEARDQNKIKIPADADFYDKWYAFYHKVENRLCSLAGLNPSDLSEANVNEMVRRDNA